MKLSVKNMVCPRCVESVNTILTEMNVGEAEVELGKVSLGRSMTAQQIDRFKEKLENRGFELIYDRETELVNIVKTSLINYLEYIQQENKPVKLSQFVSENTDYNYSYLSKIFSEKENITIETCLIKIKIERVKELLSFKKWTLSEIAWKLNYSSVQYLSNQFKKVTGQTVTQFMKENEFTRKAFDQV